MDKSSRIGHREGLSFVKTLSAPRVIDVRDPPGKTHGPWQSRRDLVLENLALRHQLAVLTASDRRPRFRPADRLVWTSLMRLWDGWRDALVLASESTVSRCLPRGRKPPSQTWRSFLENHLAELISIDFFTVPTARFQVLFCFLVLSHKRRRVLHFNVTAHPTARWTAQQIVEAFPWETAPRYLLRDRDGVYGDQFRRRVAGLDMTEVLAAPRAPWQNPYAERLIGSIRRECLDHFIVLSEQHLYRILTRYLTYYHRARTHLSLGKDCPRPRPVQPRPSPEAAGVIADRLFDRQVDRW